MKKPATTKQTNIRLDDLDLQRINDIRRTCDPIPNVSQLVRDLIAEAHERRVARPARARGERGGQA